jgi:hypothetical protein
MKYRADVTGINESSWSTNGVEFNSEEQTKRYLDGLAERWFGFDMSRVVPVDTPKHQPVDFENHIFYQNCRVKKSKL